MAGDSFAGARLSAITGTSSATATAVGFTAGFAGLGLDGAAFPPLMARSTGMSLLAFASIIFPPAFADLLVLGISTSLQFDPDPAQAYNVMRMRDIIRRAPFRLSFQSVNGIE
ncbi:MAG: hypothetical protein WAJ88_14230 [Pseudolabrys sp.]